MKGRDTFRICESALHVWYDGVVESQSLATMTALCDTLTGRGWVIGSDPHVDKHYHELAHLNRRGRRADLEVKARTSGRHVEVVFFQNIANIENRNGGEYETGIMSRMPYLLRLRAEYELATLASKCREMGLADTTDREPSDAYARAMHRRASPGMSHVRHENLPDYNCRDADGVRLEDWAVRYYRDSKGHLHRGRTFHNINNMWWVVEGSYRLWNVADWELFTFDPAKHRHRRDMRNVAVRRIQDALDKAIKDERYERAAALRDARDRARASEVKHG